jgi:pyridoxamine 5'-phosphate oxidase
MNQALQAQVLEPTAMSLATVGKDGRPRNRTVLLKGLDTRGFAFFTNLESRKAHQLAENPQAALLFPWLALERQVIVTGSVEKLSLPEVIQYFTSRPRDSQLSAWASRQSAVLSSRQVLEMEWETIKTKFAHGQIPLPSFWGGFRVKPITIEFWQGRPNRLHDRFEYTRQPDNSWAIARLAP